MHEQATKDLRSARLPQGRGRSSIAESWCSWPSGSVRRYEGRWNALPRAVISAGIGMLTLTACDLLITETPGNLVPPTAEQDPLLPQLRVSVAGNERSLHLQRFGDLQNPTALVLPGGPGADHRLLLPLRKLADRYHVVVWSPRGAGLSERVLADELPLYTFLEEIAAVHAAVAPGEPVTLIGHSHGAGLFLRYAVAHPGSVEQLVLIEPGPLTPAGRRQYRGGAVGWADGQDFFWQNEVMTSRDHAAADYKAVALLPLSFRSFTCDREPPDEYPMWRFGAFHYHVVTHGRHAPPAGFDWTEGVHAVEAQILVVAGGCGEAGERLQRDYNLEALPGARLEVVPGAGHISLFTTHAAATLAVLRAHLEAYR